jgi:hypothetical protein
MGMFSEQRWKAQGADKSSLRLIEEMCSKAKSAYKGDLPSIKVRGMLEQLH